MDPLRQYGSHAFINYLDATSTTPPPKRSGPLSTSTPHKPIEVPTPLPNPQPLKVLNTSTWTYCGPLIPPTTTSLPSSFHTWSASTIHGPFLDRLLPFLSFLHTFLPASGVHHYWLTIRVTKPTTEFDTVRWHADDIFFDKTGERGRTISSPSPAQPHPQSRPSSVLPSWTKRKPPQKEYWKLVTTLLGPGTLFLKDGASARRIQKEAKRMVCAKRGPHTCSSFKCLGCLDAIESVRLILAEQFAQADVEATKYGEVAFFRLGDDEGAIHSEPKCDEDRIFINVVPGAEDELAELMDRWGLVYPRDWSFGVPMEWRGTEGVLSPALRTVGRGVDMKEGKETRSGGEPNGKISTMSLNLRPEYMGWLEGKGFEFDQVFGLTGDAEVP